MCSKVWHEYHLWFMIINNMATVARNLFFRGWLSKCRTWRICIFCETDTTWYRWYTSMLWTMHCVSSSFVWCSWQSCCLLQKQDDKERYKSLIELNNLCIWTRLHSFDGSLLLKIGWVSQMTLLLNFETISSMISGQPWFPRKKFGLTWHSSVESAVRPTALGAAIIPPDLYSCQCELLQTAYNTHLNPMVDQLYRITECKELLIRKKRNVVTVCNH